MKVTIEELRTLSLSLFEALEKEIGNEEIEVEWPLYWDVPNIQRCNAYAEPTELTLGSMEEDWEAVNRMADGTDAPVRYGLVWLASIFRYVGGK